MDVEDYMLQKEFLFSSSLVICSDPPSITFEDKPVKPDKFLDAEDSENALEGFTSDMCGKSRHISWQEWHACMVNDVLRKCRRIQANVPARILTFNFSQVVISYFETGMEFFIQYNEVVKHMETVRKYLSSFNMIKDLSMEKNFNDSNREEYEKDLYTIHDTLVKKELKRRNWIKALTLRFVYNFKYLRTYFWLHLMRENKETMWEVRSKELNQALPKLDKVFRKLVQFRNFFRGMGSPEEILERQLDTHVDVARDLVTLKMNRGFQIFFLVLNDWITQKVEDLNERLDDIDELYLNNHDHILFMTTDTGEEFDFYINSDMADRIRDWNLDWFDRDSDALRRVLSRTRRRQARLND